MRHSVYSTDPGRTPCQYKGKIQLLTRGVFPIVYTGTSQAGLTLATHKLALRYSAIDFANVNYRSLANFATRK